MSLVKRDQEPQQECCVILREGKTPVWRVRACMYWQIVNELRWRGVKLGDAKAAADWARKAHAGETFTINVPHSMTLEAVEE